MREAVIVAQGDELLTGQTVDTNSHFIAGRLWDRGVNVRRVLSAPDQLDDLVDVLQRASQLAPFVVCTGGLGPTGDDLTAQAVASAFGRPLETNAQALEQIRFRFREWGRNMPPANEKQALLPVGACPLENRWGTAPGFTLAVEGSELVFLPGVPREMRPMFETWVLPMVDDRLSGSPPVLHVIRVMGLPESVLEQQVRPYRSDRLRIGFRAKLPENQVKLLFSADVPESERREQLQQVIDAIGPKVFGVDSGDLAHVVGEKLACRGQSIALAESCTAGKLAAWVGGVPGASRYFLEGAVVYSNEAKTRTCGVPAALIANEGAVSEPVARALAEGMCRRAGSTWGIGITGIAGPGGGTPDKPVGTVHVAVAGPDGTSHKCHRLVGDRDRITTLAAAGALSMLNRRMGP